MALLAANLVVGVLLLVAVLARGGPAHRRVWRRATALARRDPAAAPPPALVARSLIADPATLESAIARSTAFLKRRLRGGDYGLTCIGADGQPRFSDNKGHVFVAAFITEALAGSLGEIDRALVIVRILSEESDGQWGFSPPGPCHGQETMVFHVDADDTACVIRTLRRLGVNRAPESLLAYYREPQGLFVTFNSGQVPALTVQPSPANNFLAHPEVNSNVFLALRGTHLEDYARYEVLKKAQDRGGGWPSYFYPSPLYGTLMALDALEGKAAFAGSAERGRVFVAGLQNADGSWGPDGDPYETALAVAALAGQADYQEAVARGVAHLLTAMTPKGSWASKACIWEFHAGPDDVWRAFDTHAAYVSARCLIALRRAAGQLTAFS